MFLDEPLPTAAKKDFEMEILESSGQQKDESVKLTISSGRFFLPHAHCQTNLVQHFLLPDFSYLHTNDTQTCPDWMEKNQITTHLSVDKVENITAGGVNRKLTSN